MRRQSEERLNDKLVSHEVKAPDGETQGNMASWEWRPAKFLYELHWNPFVPGRRDLPLNWCQLEVSFPNLGPGFYLISPSDRSCSRDTRMTDPGYRP